MITTHDYGIRSRHWLKHMIRLLDHDNDWTTHPIYVRHCSHTRCVNMRINVCQSLFSMCSMCFIRGTTCETHKNNDYLYQCFVSVFNVLVNVVILVTCLVDVDLGGSMCFSPYLAPIPLVLWFDPYPWNDRTITSNSTPNLMIQLKHISDVNRTVIHSRLYRNVSIIVAI